MIIDFQNQVSDLKIQFARADYYVCNEQGAQDYVTSVQQSKDLVKEIISQSEEINNFIKNDLKTAFKSELTVESDLRPGARGGRNNPTERP
jgi:hypothetical protein